MKDNTEEVRRTGRFAPRGAHMAEARMVVDRLAERARQGPESLDRALEAQAFPVVGDGWAVFVYRGRADEVSLHLWVSGLPSAQTFHRIKGTDLWTLEAEIQHGARLEYKLEVVNGRDHELIRDPLNPTFAEDPFGANSVVQGLSYAKPEWASEQPEARRGTVVDRHLHSEVFGEDRPFSVYLPARFRETQHYPLLIVHDGDDYLRFSSLATVLDNLIHRLEIPPVLAALVQSPNRLTEYGASDEHARFLIDELLPHLGDEFPLLDEPGDRALVGASFGAVASLHTAWSRPGTFGKLLLQSGSFAFTDVGDHEMGPSFDTVVEFVNEFRKDPGRPADQIFLSAGIYESLIYFNRSLLPVLQGTGAEVRLVEAQDGHNWENWRDRLRDGLTWLFPGPLWMFYE
jgi:enterochelin esterase family protein